MWQRVKVSCNSSYVLFPEKKNKRSRCLAQRRDLEITNTINITIIGLLSELLKTARVWSVIQRSLYSSNRMFGFGDYVASVWSRSLLVPDKNYVLKILSAVPSNKVTKMLILNKCCHYKVFRMFTASLCITFRGAFINCVRLRIMAYGCELGLSLWHNGMGTKAKIMWPLRTVGKLNRLDVYIK